jgi:DNA-binding response OmpR family regulator
VIASHNFVLVVEDDPAIVEVVQAQLERAGFRVDSAHDGQEGMEKTFDSLPDVIVLDLSMPKVDGFEMLRRLRDQRALRDIPVLVLSARSSRTDVLTALDLGARDYMVKPFDGRDLVGRVRGLLTSSPDALLI